MSPFEILGISDTSNASEIKTAYRNLAKKYHPDVNKDKSSDSIFKKINEAYTQALALCKDHVFEGIDLFDNMYISVNESLGNLNKLYNLMKSVPCDCGSLGIKCFKCHGARVIKHGFTGKSKCTRCNGSGYENPKNCIRCNGSGTKSIIESIKITSNQVINDGELRSFNYTKGKLWITFNIRKSDEDVYDRINDDLVYLAKISPLDQILGTNLFIPRLNQESIRLQIKENVPIPSYFKISNSGVPGTQGDLIVKLVTDSKLLNTNLIPIIRSAVRG